MDSNPFVLWGQDMLVVTDLDWRVAPTPASTFGADRVLIVSLHTRDLNGAFRGTPHTTADLQITNEHLEVGYVSGQEHIVAGFVVGAGRILCVSARSLKVGAGSAHTVIETRLHGYIVSRQ